MVMRRFLGALACVALLAASDASLPALAAGDTSDLFDPQAALAYSQAAIGRQVGDGHGHSDRCWSLRCLGFFLLQVALRCVGCHQPKQDREDPQD